MKKLLVLLALLTVPISGIAQERRVGPFQFVARHGNHTAKLSVRARAFVRANHKLSFANAQYLKRKGITLGKGVSLLAKVDGRDPLGTDGDVPRVEIESMVVAFNGQKVVVPESLYSNCFNPNLGNEDFVTKLNEAGDSLLVFMAGSDAAGSYQVMWILRRDGRHSRFVNSCSDSECDSSGLFSFMQNQRIE